MDVVQSLTWNSTGHKDPKRYPQGKTQIDWQVLPLLLFSRGHLGNGATSKQLQLHDTEICYWGNECNKQSGSSCLKTSNDPEMKRTRFPHNILRQVINFTVLSRRNLCFYQVHYRGTGFTTPVVKETRRLDRTKCSDKTKTEKSNKKT